MTSSVSTTNSSTSSASSTSASRTQLAGNMSMFLTLLTTQLQHQDPLSPMDSTEFTSQLVQYAAVEQQININENLEKVLAAQQDSAMSTAVSYIGCEIQATSSVLPLEDGSAEFAYTTPSDSAQVTVTIYDSSGNSVYTTTGDTTAGTHFFTWDGTDSSGEQLDDGSYIVKVSSYDSSKTVTSLETAVTGTVSSVAQDSGTVYLMMGGAQVALDDVVTVSAKSSSTASQ